jgi:hypothetical protein
VREEEEKEEERGREAGRRICAQEGGWQRREWGRVANLRAGEGKRGGSGEGRKRMRRIEGRRKERRGAILIGRVSCWASR